MMAVPLRHKHPENRKFHRDRRV